MKFFIVCLAILAVVNAQERKAIAKLVGAIVNGNVTFIQHGDGPVLVQGLVLGLAPGKYGFHVHDKGDITGGCLSAGGHFNPHKVTHGGPNDQIRHVGDLGNIESKNIDEPLEIQIVDHVISLSGEHNIIGRTLMIHAGEDDLGKSNHPDSKTTGNAGARSSCGVIGILNLPAPEPTSAPRNAGIALTSSFAIVALILIRMLR